MAADAIARTLYWQYRCEEALPVFDVALAGFGMLHEELEAEAALAREVLAECLHELGRLDVAMAEHRLALAYWETERPEIAVQQQHGHLELARILGQLGRSAEAEQEYERVLAVVDPTATDYASRRHAREELAALRGR